MLSKPKPANGLPRRAFTVEEVRRMIDAGVIGEDERIELIQGDIVVLAHNQVAHDLIKSVLAAALLRMAPNELLVGVATTLQFGDDSLVDADIALIRRAGYQPSKSGYARPQPADILLVIEIAAEHLNHDKDVKARLYARHGIREFWVIDANERITWIHTQPTGDTWGLVIEHRPADTLTTPALPGFSIRLAEID